MNAKISVFVNCSEAIIHLLLYDLHDSTFKRMGKWENARKRCMVEFSFNKVL